MGDVRDDLFVCARSGDLQRVQYLVEVKGQSVNQINEWQASPLFYACLTGHAAIVKYLLEQGARCEANTFDGERCQYGLLLSNCFMESPLAAYRAANYAALTTDIRKYLQEFKTVIRASDALSDFMIKIFNREDMFSDVCFDVNGEEKILAHRAVLAVRSPYMYEQLVAEGGRWAKKPEIRFRNAALNAVAWKAILRALYCGRTELPRDMIQTALMICHQCKLPRLGEALLDAEVNSEGAWVRVSMESVVVLSLSAGEEEYSELKRNLALLARAATPSGYQTLVSATEPPAAPLAPVAPPPAAAASTAAASGLAVDLLSSSSDGVPLPAGTCNELLADLRALSDVTFVVEDEKFYCHRVFMLRCEYFKAMLRGGFREASDATVIPLGELTPDVFAIIIEYIYTDRVQRLLSMDSALLHDVLRVADLFLLTGLKTLCATYITQHVTSENVFELYRTAVLYALPRLEESTTQHMAIYIDDVVRLPEFAALVRESAATIKERQGVDSVPLIDDIRSHLAILYGARQQLGEGEEMDDYEANKEAMLQHKRALLDELLQRIGIGALNRLGVVADANR